MRRRSSDRRLTQRTSSPRLWRAVTKAAQRDGWESPREVRSGRRRHSRDGRVAAAAAAAAVTRRTAAAGTFARSWAVNKILLASLFHGDERQHDGILQGNTYQRPRLCEKKRTWTAVLVNYEGHTGAFHSRGREGEGCVCRGPCASVCQVVSASEPASDVAANMPHLACNTSEKRETVKCLNTARRRHRSFCIWPSRSHLPFGERTFHVEIPRTSSPWERVNYKLKFNLIAIKDQKATRGQGQTKRAACYIQPPANGRCKTDDHRRA